jgi:hypothetical protein
MAAPVQRLNSPCLCLWMTALKASSPVLARRLQRSVGLGSLAGDTKGQEADELDSYRLPEIRHLQKKINKSIFFIWRQVLLTLGFFFHRATAARTVVEGCIGHFSAVCASTV